jgi:alkylhydroperoxidase/carboxymuconolactone decarboxylase family protein YurZ
VVDLPSSPLAEVDPVFEQMALETGTRTFGVSGTSTREKFLQLFAYDVCSHTLGMAFRMHLMAATTMHGVPYADVLAVIRFVAPYSGYPAAADALGTLPELARSLGLDTSVPADAALDSVDGGRPGQPGPTHTSSDAWMSEFLASRVGRSWSEERLSPRERAFVALTADVCLQTLGDTFRRHVRVAQEDGVPDEDIRDAIRFTAELGIARTVNALEELQKILGEESECMP